MRRVFSFSVVFAVLLFVFVPTFAQEEDPTIADIVVASTEAETPEFTVLLAAVGAADPLFLEALSDPEMDLTVFAPTDAAFVALLEELGMTAEEVLADTDLLNAVLAYHVVPGVFTSESVAALNGGYLGTVLNGDPVFISADEEGVYVDDSTIVTVDIAASNGVVHVIDAVLVPDAETDEEMMEETEPMEEPGSIADIVVASSEAETPEFSVLLAAVSAADPMVLEMLTNGGPWTVFAPTDAAFASALEQLGLTAEELLADTETLTSVLAYHVLPGTYTLADITSLAEGAVEMEMDGLYLATALGGTAVEIGEGTVNGVTIVSTDVMAGNGVIHVIDGVLLPPTDEE